MISETALKLVKCFPRSFINQHGEFIAHREANEFNKFILEGQVN